MPSVLLYTALAFKILNRHNLYLIRVIVMLIILDGNSEHVAHLCRKKGLFLNNIKFVTSVDLNKGLKQILIKLAFFSTRTHPFLGYHLLYVP